MTDTVRYYYSHASPWSFLGHRRLGEIARKAGARIDYRPVTIAEIFPKTGGVPLAKRAPERQAYRMVELKRWAPHMGIEIVYEPAHFPVDDKPAARLAALAARKGHDIGPLSEAIMRAVWQEERDIADGDTLIAIADAHGLAGRDLYTESQGEAGERAMQANCEAALADGCFGVPWYMVGDEPFWGQDRLDFVARRLGANG